MNPLNSEGSPGPGSARPAAPAGAGGLDGRTLPGAGGLDGRPWLETLSLMAAGMGPQRPFQASLSGLLRMLSARHGFLRAHLVLFEPETGLLRLSLADTPPRRQHADYSPGEGVTGQVFTTGTAVIVERMRDHPLFLSRLFERTDEELDSLSFLCVPVLAPAPGGSALAAREVIGTLNADTPFISREDLELRRAFLQAAAALIANEAAYLQEDMARQRRLPTDMPSEYRGDEPAEDTAPFVAQSKVMRHILEQAAHAAQGRAPVLLRGEAGVGKQSLATRIHAASPRRDMPLVVCHCGAVPPERMEAELRGYRKGAFPGALQTRKGLFEQAHLGTLFLDAVEELRPGAQAALLRLLQKHEVSRLGGTEAAAADVRVIAASGAALEDMARRGAFSADLFARLNVCALHIPPLRERREDIIPLAEHELRRHAERGGQAVRRISRPALELLSRYYWPGNVPELKSCLSHAARHCHDQVIRSGDLPPSLQTAESSATGADLSLGEAVIHFEKEMLVDALIKAGGNMLKAARALKSSYRIVNYKVKKYGIDPHQFSFRNRAQAGGAAETGAQPGHARRA
ncbi:MAG: sigma-54-dependent Fis family transcriptional regulator [Desulfovibrionaceae bacterium]|nr:sigma-54-dependent Fis family transcriptional regulator [Desulfovibrionaceae bacterium]